MRTPSDFEVTLAPGATLWQVGEPADTLAIVHSGEVVAVNEKGEPIFAFLPGEVLGETCLLNALFKESRTRVVLIRASAAGATIALYPVEILLAELRSATHFASDACREILFTLLFNTLTNYYVLRRAIPPGALHDHLHHLYTAAYDMYFALSDGRLDATLRRTDEFAPVFRVLYDLREASRASLTSLVPKPDQGHIQSAKAMALEGRRLINPRLLLEEFTRALDRLLPPGSTA